MDRTAEFRRLVAGLGGSSPANDDGGRGKRPFGSSAFMQRAGELRGKLLVLRRDLKRRGGGGNDSEADAGAAADIQACKQGMTELEALVEDVEGLGERTPAPGRRQDFFNFRRGVVQGLYEELRDLASAVQAEQMQEMRHETEVSSFFTAGTASSAPSARRKPPPPIQPDLVAGKSGSRGRGGLGGGGGGGAAGAQESHGSGAAAPTEASESLKAEELQLLAAYETNLDQIHQVKQKLGEVATMVSVFATKAEEQQEMAETILGDAEVATHHVEEASKHLQKANDNKSSYNFYIVCWFLGSAFFLLIFDFIDARYSWI